MKKTIIVLSMLFLTACTEEKTMYEQAVLEQMQKEQDVIDYNIDPELMTACVVDVTSRNMPGIVSIDPRRWPFYKGYSKLISATSSVDPQKNIQEVRELFGSTEEIRKALKNYSEGVMECMTALVSKEEQELQKDN